MDSKNIIFVICLLVIIVVGINAALFAALRRKEGISQIELIRRAAQRAQRPWGDEEDALNELAKRVAELKAENQSTDKVNKPDK